ncbi:cytochrome b/b6 domain-containing protein [Streptomyces albicerus]|uniref:cytochrome b/b6 domain-containing protein n=1 Tax=Streptomyces albicerus TaxID=2569859 RepID=UPI00124B2B32|nr:cytochrome b/b6 domain-containing protein [Streptomyces albicerus]
MTDDSTVDDSFAEFLNFGAGVLSLVCLTTSVLWGLIAQDRILLNARQRMLAQAVHRTTAVASIVFLLVHIGVKLALEHTSWIAAVIPFGLLATNDEDATGRAFLIGLGTLASMLMIFVAITGLLRHRFASPAPVAARWRAMHMLAYPAWCAALVHGLLAGREAKPIFVILYCLSLVAVGGALSLRMAPQPFKYKVARRIQDMIGSDERQLREKPAARRATEDSSFPGARSRRDSQEAFMPQQGTSSASSSLYDTGQNAALTDTSGFAAAYRAVSNTPRAQDPLTPDPTQRMQVPLDMQPTEAMPRVDGNTGARWPTPSPPLYEAPPRPAGTPTYDTGTIPTYDANAAYDTGTIPAYGGSDVYDTGETNNPLGTYNPNDTYNSGPATETQPGSYEAPSNGEPWNAPSGGY